MKEKLILLKRQKSYPLNSRPSNRYLNKEHNYIQNIAYTQNNNNILSEEYNNILENENMEIDDLYNDDNIKNNNIHTFKSINDRYKNKYYLDLKESNRLKKENNSLFTSLKQIEKESKIKDIEINRYKQKMKALLNQIKEKNNILYNKNNLILKLYDEQEVNHNLLKKNSNTLLRSYNDQLQNFKNKKNELENKIN